MSDFFTIFQDNNEAIVLSMKDPVMSQIYSYLRYNTEEENKHFIIDIIVKLIKEREDLVNQLISERKQNAALAYFRYGE